MVKKSIFDSEGKSKIVTFTLPIIRVKGTKVFGFRNFNPFEVN